jgi:transposase
MGQVLHGCATTTEAIRRAIQHSQEGLRRLSRRYGINSKTVAKWNLFVLSEAQMRRIESLFPLSHGVPRVDDRRVVSGIVFVIRNGLRWRDAPREYSPHKIIYNRFVRWSRLGVFNKISKKEAVPKRIGRTKGGLNSKLHAVCDGLGRPLIMLLSEGQMSDYKVVDHAQDAFDAGPSQPYGVQNEGRIGLS